MSEYYSINEFLEIVAENSKAPDKKVGCVAFKDNNPVSVGWNLCADEGDDSTVNTDGETKEETLHAEEVMIMNSIKLGVDISECVVYLTHSPCKHCASLLHYVGVKKVYYIEVFKKSDGISYLERNGVVCKMLE